MLLSTTEHSSYCCPEASLLLRSTWCGIDTRRALLSRMARSWSEHHNNTHGVQQNSSTGQSEGAWGLPVTVQQEQRSAGGSLAGC